MKYFSMFSGIGGFELGIGEKGECIGVVGESGCGKSTLAAAILKLIDKAEGSIKSPSINYFSDNNENGINLMDLSAEEMRKIRGKKISMIMQDPYSSLNPVIRIGNQLREAYLVHNASYEKADEVIREKLDVNQGELFQETGVHCGAGIGHEFQA